MKNFILLLTLIVTTFTAFAQPPFAINKGRLQSDLNANGWSISSLGGFTVTYLGTNTFKSDTNSVFIYGNFYSTSGALYVTSTTTTKNHNAAPTQIALTGSPFTYTVTNAENVNILISGSAVTAISLNGTTLASGLSVAAFTTLPCQSNDVVIVTYTGAPTMYWKSF